MFTLELFHLMEKICIKNIGVAYSTVLEKMKTQICFLFKKPSLVAKVDILVNQSYDKHLV